MPTNLADQIEQIAEGLWRWSVWVEDDSSDRIEQVVYTLDSSFSNPVRRTRERDSKFKIADVASGSFTIFARIRLASGADLRLEKRLELGPDNNEHSHPRHRPIILAVDDDVNVLEAVIQDLRRRYGASFRMMRASSGKEALETLQMAKDAGDEVALIVSDQRMPEMLGVRFVTLAKQCFPLAKVLLLTAYLDAETAVEAINVGKVDYYFTKPWDPPEEKLYPVIDELLNAWHPIRRIRAYG